MPTEAGFLVGLVTHNVSKVGSLVWVAKPTFDEEPTLEQTSQITEWRWPVLFPLAAAIRQAIVSPIGQVAVPMALQSFPTLRSGERRIGWVALTEIDGVRSTLGPTTDRSLPIYQIVNDTRLKEMVVSDWNPDDDF
jgi:hypothetical protein